MRLFIDTGNVAEVEDEGRALRQLHEHIVVKVPFNKEGLEANHPLTDAGAEKFREDWQSRPGFGEWLGELTQKRLAATG